MTDTVAPVLPPVPTGELWARWTLGSTLGGLLGLLLGPFVAVVILAGSFSVVDPLLGQSQATRPLYTVISLIIWFSALGSGAGVVGAIVAAGQRLSLRGHLALDQRWIGVTALGWAIGFPVSWFAVLVTFPWLPSPLALALISVLPGLLVGTGQWFLLRRQGVAAGWWIGGTLVAFVASWFLGGLALQPLPASVGSGMLAGFTGGVITGFVLIRQVPGAAIPGDR